MDPIKIQKIPLNYIVEGLTELYEKGYEYFDLTLIVTNDEDQDVISISVLPSYKIPEMDPDDDLDYENLI